MAPVTDISEFKSALRKGTGRAAMLISTDPHSPTLQAELMEACIRNLVYDPQCEETRAPYLRRLIQRTGQIRRYWDALVECLSQPDREMDEPDRVQIFEILCALSADDGPHERGVLEAMLRSMNFNSLGRDCMESFVRLQGIDGLVTCFCIFSDKIGRQDWNEDWSFRSLLDVLAERDGEKVAAAELRKAGSECPNFDQALRRLRPYRRTDGPSASTSDPTMIAEAVSRNEGIPFQWIRDASRDDLEWAAEELLRHLDDRDEKRSLAYLRVFWKRDFPRPAQRLVDAATSDSRKLANATVLALRRLRRPEIRTLALALIGAGKHAENGVRLLQSNFERGDFTVVERLLEAADKDEHVYHGIGVAALDVILNNSDVTEESRGTLLHLYKNGPCSHCRERAVLRLVRLGGVPAWMVDECRYDCVPAIAAHFREAQPPTVPAPLVAVPLGSGLG